MLAAAIRAANRGEGRLPHEVLIRMIGGTESQPAAERPRATSAPLPLTSRQRAVLALMAEGFGNAEIARMLRCSEQSIKNVIYDLTARLQAHNRAHAVAAGVREGII